MLRELVLREEGAVPTIDLTLVTVDGKPGKAREVVEWLTDRPELVKLVKRETLTRSGDDWVPLDADWPALAAPAATP
jgi:hypothetical protein